MRSVGALIHRFVIAGFHPLIHDSIIVICVTLLIHCLILYTRVFACLLPCFVLYESFALRVFKRCMYISWDVLYHWYIAAHCVIYVSNIYYTASCFFNHVNSYTSRTLVHNMGVITVTLAMEVKYHPSKHDTLILGWFDVGPASQMVAQHQTNLESTCRVCWDTLIHTLSYQVVCYSQTCGLTAWPDWARCR